MKLSALLSQGISNALKILYQLDFDAEKLQLQKTKKEFDGDVTVVVFPFVKASKKSPESTAHELGEFLVSNIKQVENYNVIKGFLNLTITSAYYAEFLNDEAKSVHFGFIQKTDQSEKIMIEYSSPNTNKPLHLGHIRNNLLGWSVAEILKANGKEVIKTNIVNDRGIHICKSMLAWQKWGNGETPDSSGKKGDHLVGDYYVKFDLEYKKEIAVLKAEGKTDDEAAKTAPLILEAQEMLRKWEAHDENVLKLWSTMNAWVYDGFSTTYKRLGVDFDEIYYESDTYLVGRNTVISGLDRGVFYQRPDNSVWVDLTAEGLDEKILLRSDGTSVYMTQDIGTAQLRQSDYSPKKMIYVVGNEQNYHFKVLALVLDKLGYAFAKDLYHLSYGMVELPEGKMKSREGTVVDADDLMDEMIATSRSMADELGKLEGIADETKDSIYTMIGLGALKYFMLKVDPAKNMTFDPKESIDFNGNTGPFIQYTHARIRSIIRKAQEAELVPYKIENITMNAKEKSLLKLIYDFPDVITEAGQNYSPALVANYTYELAKEYNQFYHEYTILKEEDMAIRNFRIYLSEITGSVIKKSMGLLGIEVPERM